MNKPLSPVYLNAFIILTIVLHFIFPIKVIIHAPITYIGVVFILIGLGINIRSANLLNEKKTAVEFHETPRKLVVEGPFRVSRNPIYLGGVIVLCGIAILLGSIITFVFPILLFLILNGIYIPLEEKRMAELFGEEYLEYKQRVRRWI